MLLYQRTVVMKIVIYISAVKTNVIIEISISNCMLVLQETLAFVSELNLEEHGCLRVSYARMAWSIYITRCGWYNRYSGFLSFKFTSIIAPLIYNTESFLIYVIVIALHSRNLKTNWLLDQNISHLSMFICSVGALTPFRFTSWTFR